MNYKFEAYSIAGLTIVIAGLLRLYVYYKSFKISILPFLEPGEIATIFFDNLLYFLVFTLFNVLVISILYAGVLGKITINMNTTLWQRLIQYGIFKLNKLIILLALAAFLFCFFLISNSVLLYEFLLWTLMLFIALFINPIVIFEFKRALLNSKIEMNQLSIYFIIASLNLFAFAGLSGLNEANKVKNHGYYVGTEFVIDGSEIFISDDVKYYIGKTKQFVFFYDSKENVTEVIPMSNIKKMKYN